MIEVTWAQLKTFVNDRKVSIQEIDLDPRLMLVALDGAMHTNCYIYKELEPEALADYVANYQGKANAAQGQVSDDGRVVVAVNRIAAGYTIYPSGKSDALQASGYRAGVDMIFDADNKVRRFQMLSNWYGIGGRVIWEGADLADYMSAKLKAPATAHGVNAAGDFNKYALGGGANMYIPAAPGAGAWSLSLTEKHTGTNVLKCVPVPVAGNAGYFDYNSTTNVVTVNATQTGGYNLYDFEVTLFQFASHCWGKKQDGSESSIEIPDVIGKLLFSQWVIEFTLTTAKTSGIKVGMIMIAAVKGNT